MKSPGLQFMTALPSIHGVRKRTNSQSPTAFNDCSGSQFIYDLPFGHELQLRCMNWLRHELNFVHELRPSGALIEAKASIIPPPQESNRLSVYLSLYIQHRLRTVFLSDRKGRNVTRTG